MKMSLDQALLKGIEAHKAGHFYEADCLYTAILESHPQNPDANHNMGVLAVDVGKPNEALRFFKRALEENQSVAQFWLSYIDALIKLERISDATAVLMQARDKGIKSKAIDQLETSLNCTDETSSLSEVTSLLRRATAHKDAGELATATALLTAGQKKFSRNAEILSLLAHCYILNSDLENASTCIIRAKGIDTQRACIGWNEARLHLAQNNVELALSVARSMNDRFPNNMEGMVILADCLREKGEIEESINYLNEAILFNPKHADALLRRSIIHLDSGDKAAALTDLENAYESKPYLKEACSLLVGLKIEFGQFGEAIPILEKMVKRDLHDEKLFVILAHCNSRVGNLKSAIDNYRKAIKIKPDHVDAHINLGVALRNTGDLVAAIDSYKLALKLKPDHAEARNNMGTAFYLHGKLEAAIDSFKQALRIRSDYASCFMNLKNIQVQIPYSHQDTSWSNDKDTNPLKMKVIKIPRFHILQAISNLISGNHYATKESLVRYSNLIKDRKGGPKKNDDLFCSRYFNFLSQLIRSNLILENLELQSIYHIGESHCLSYAHCTLKRDDVAYSIKPRITLGAKAHHFSMQGENGYKAITRQNLETLPRSSIVFVSVGEIDCRASEGLIPASQKTGEELENVVDATVEGYVSWFQRANKSLGHEYHFFNVPAPVYDQGRTRAENLQVAKVVAFFNEALSQKLQESNIGMIDVYNPTKNVNGFSNRLYHCDSSHLDSRILGIIQKQWNC